MPKHRTVPPEHPAFADLPVRIVTLSASEERMAVHVQGQITTTGLPLICVPGYQRNMSEFADFVRIFGRVMGAQWPVLLVDLLGRGRSSDRLRPADYLSTNDARDLSRLADAFGIERAIFLGEGYGGQVVMSLAAERPRLVGGAILVDAGPMTDSRGLVRLRNNLQHIESLRGEAVLRASFRQILAADYPGAPEGQLDGLALRTHAIDKRGRAQALFDPFLLKRLESFEYDDVLVAQWPLFDALAGAPLFLLRTHLSDQLRRETFEEMAKRREDALALVIAGQGSPALLDHAEEANAIASFVRDVTPALETTVAASSGA